MLLMCLSATKLRYENRSHTCSCMLAVQSVSLHFSQDAAPLEPVPIWK